MRLFKPFEGLSKSIWILAFVNLINRCGSMIMCFLSLYITEALGYDITYAGYAMAIYGGGAIAGQQLGGYLTDRIGYKKVQLGSFILTGSMILVLMNMHNFIMLCGVLFLLNMVSEAFRPANSVAISAYSSDETRTRSFSLMRMAFNLAVAFALTMGGWLITLGWHYIFWADALTCFAAGLALFLLVPDGESRKEKVIYTQAESPVSVSPYRDKLYRRFIFITFLGAMAFMQIIWTLPPFFKTVYGWDEFRIGAVSAVNGVVVLFLEMPLVHRLEKNWPPLRTIRTGLFIYAFSYLLLCLPPSWQWTSALMYMVFISFGEIMVMPFSITWATRLAPQGRQGQYMSAYGMAYAVANIAAPLMGTQIIYHFGYNILWIVVAAISLAAAAYTLSVKASPARL